NDLVGGTLRTPKPPEKTIQNVTVLNQKKGPKWTHFRSLFLARSSRFFRRLRRKKCPFIRCLFSVVGPKKEGLIQNKVTSYL
ncbi:MAG: hypothetical protein KC455_08380, partial [Carnobacterium sp.]|nr:hypothetical protein [Carnobacterium sp.]